MEQANKNMETLIYIIEAIKRILKSLNIGDVAFSTYNMFLEHYLAVQANWTVSFCIFCIFHTLSAVLSHHPSDSFDSVCAVLMSVVPPRRPRCGQRQRILSGNDLLILMNPLEKNIINNNRTVGFANFDVM